MANPPQALTGATLRTLLLAMRALFSCFLLTVGLGYLAAVTLIFLGDVDPHRKMGMGLVADIAVKYYGNRANTRLESALRGPMATVVGAQERAKVIAWLRGGASREGFEAVKPIFLQTCATCHSAKSGLPVPPLTTFEEVKKFAKVDTEYTLVQLARVSHIHLFGISIIFLLTGAIFAMSEISWKWRLPIITVPFFAIWADIGSWWITKFEPVFAWVVMIGGAFMGLALAAQILISLWEMWLAPERPRAAQAVRWS